MEKFPEEEGKEQLARREPEELSVTEAQRRVAVVNVPVILNFMKTEY